MEPLGRQRKLSLPAEGNCATGRLVDREVGGVVWGGEGPSALTRAVGGWVLVRTMGSGEGTQHPAAAAVLEERVAKRTYVRC